MRRSLLDRRKLWAEGRRDGTRWTARRSRGNVKGFASTGISRTSPRSPLLAATGRAERGHSAGRGARGRARSGEPRVRGGRAHDGPGGSRRAVLRVRRRPAHAGALEVVGPSTGCRRWTAAASCASGVSRDNGEVVVTVADTGRGMPLQISQTSSSPSTRRNGAGAGLGLSIAGRIIAAHGGRIDVESIVGWGSGFMIRLPLDGS